MTATANVKSSEKAQLVLMTQNRAVSRCLLKFSETGQIVAASTGLLWPLGLFIAGLWGVAGMATLSLGIVFLMLKSGAEEAKQIEQGVASGNFAKAGQYLNQDDLSDIKREAQALGLVEEPKKTSPEMGQTTTQNSATSSTGMPKDSDGNESPSNLPRAIAQLDDTAPHLFMVGRTREGKSETLKHLIGAERRVWYVTSKATDRVPEHWQGYRVGGPRLGEQMTWLLDQWEASLLNHLEGKDKAREWFVIDEAIGVLQSLKTKGHKAIAARLAGFVVECVTSGAAVGSLVGILTQSGNAGPLGIDEDLLKNFSIVGCGKRKKAQMVKAFCKLTDLKLTAQQEDEILSLEGYWQLWENNGPCLSYIR